MSTRLEPRFGVSLPSLSDMPQIYVHIGLPKTATTTLQTQVFMSHPDWVYLGTKLPRILNVDPTFKLLEGYVQRGEGRAEDVRNALRRRIELEGKPLFVSEENFSIGAFPGLAPGHRMAQTRRQKQARLAEVLDGLDVVVLVGLRRFRDAVYSAYVEYQDWYLDCGMTCEELVMTSDSLGMYRYADLRNELESLWPNRVHALDFDQVIKGRIAFPGFAWQQPSKPLPNMRQHPKSQHGVVRETKVQRPLKPIAELLASSMPQLSRWLWGLKTAKRVVVPCWTDDVWETLSPLEQASEAARKAWLSESR